MIIVHEKKKSRKESMVTPLAEFSVRDFLDIFVKNRVSLSFKAFDIVNVSAVAVLSSIGDYIAKRINTSTIEFEGKVDGFVMQLNKITKVLIMDEGISFKTSDHGFIKFYFENRNMVNLFVYSSKQ